MLGRALVFTAARGLLSGEPAHASSPQSLMGFSRRVLFRGSWDAALYGSPEEGRWRFGVRPREMLRLRLRGAL